MLNDVHWDNDREMWEVCIGDQVVSYAINLPQAVRSSTIEKAYGTCWGVLVDHAAERIEKEYPVKKGRLNAAVHIAKATKWEARKNVFVVLGEDQEKYRLERGAVCICKDRDPWCKHRIAHEIILEARHERAQEETARTSNRA